MAIGARSRAWTGRSPTREDLLRLARRRFLRGEKLEIQALAEELGISRATAYRWAGNADELAGRVLALLGEETFARALKQAEGTGAERIIDAMERGMRYIVGSKAYRSFLHERDSETALKIVASKDGHPQGTMIRLHQELLDEEVEAGNLKLPVDTHTMAYALVRLAETFMYSDIIIGEEPDIDSAVKILKLMLR